MKKLLEHLRKIVAKTNQTEIRVKKLIKRKGEKIDKKSWIDKKNIITYNELLSRTKNHNRKK